MDESAPACAEISTQTFGLQSLGSVCKSNDPAGENTRNIELAILGQLNRLPRRAFYLFPAPLGRPLSVPLRSMRAPGFRASLSENTRTSPTIGCSF